MDQTDHRSLLAGKVAGRLTTWLRTRYAGAGAAKRIARDLGCSVPTAKRWLTGALPDAPTLLLMLERWGAPFAAEVLAPTGPWAEDVRCSVELDELHARLTATAALIRRTATPPIRVAAPAAARSRRVEARA